MIKKKLNNKQIENKIQKSATKKHNLKQINKILRKTTALTKK